MYLDRSESAFEKQERRCEVGLLDPVFEEIHVIEPNLQVNQNSGTDKAFVAGDAITIQQSPEPLKKQKCHSTTKLRSRPDFETLDSFDSTHRVRIIQMPGTGHPFRHLL